MIAAKVCVHCVFGALPAPKPPSPPTTLPTRPNTERPALVVGGVPAGREGPVRSLPTPEGLRKSTSLPALGGQGSELPHNIPTEKPAANRIRTLHSYVGSSRLVLPNAASVTWPPYLLLSGTWRSILHCHRPGFEVGCMSSIAGQPARNFSKYIIHQACLSRKRWRNTVWYCNIILLRQPGFPPLCCALRQCTLL